MHSHPVAHVKNLPQKSCMVVQVSGRALVVFSIVAVVPVMLQNARLM